MKVKDLNSKQLGVSSLLKNYSKCNVQMRPKVKCLKMYKIYIKKEGIQ